MKAGRELDALVAEKVMGWTNLEGGQYWLAGKPPTGPAEDVPYYSTDIAAAWEVVEKLGLLRGLSLGDVGEGKWGVFTNQNVILATGESAPHAICLAALKAVGALPN